jgi:hypothetical protein
MSPGRFNERNHMKNLAYTGGLIALCLAKARLFWLIWLTVVGVLVLIGAARVVYAWRNRVH